MGCPPVGGELASMMSDGFCRDDRDFSEDADDPEAGRMRTCVSPWEVAALGLKNFAEFGFVVFMLRCNLFRILIPGSNIKIISGGGDFRRNGIAGAVEVNAMISDEFVGVVG
jgi:hypothetical protein